jgi:hypothetical protein
MEHYLARVFDPARDVCLAGAGRLPVRYVSDQKWWSALADPPRDIGNALLHIENTSDLLWVDFTAYDIWPTE